MHTQFSSVCDFILHFFLLCSFQGAIGKLPFPEGTPSRPNNADAISRRLALQRLSGRLYPLG